MFVLHPYLLHKGYNGVMVDKQMPGACLSTSWLHLPVHWLAESACVLVGCIPLSLAHFVTSRMLHASQPRSLRHIENEKIQLICSVPQQTSNCKILKQSAFTVPLVGRAGSILWGRFVFSVDFDVTGLSPENMTVPVTCHVSWGADKAVVAHEELTGTFELLQVAHELL